MTDTALLQDKLGLQQTDAFNEATEQALRQFQQQHGIDATGNPDPQTAAAMAIYDPVAGTSAKYQQYLVGGKEPGHFGRDFVTALNQIPRWGWITGGVLFGGLAVLSWYQRGRKEKE